MYYNTSDGGNNMKSITNLILKLLSVLTIVAQVIFSLVSNIFANSWSQIGIYVIFIAILYTIYLVFKYGVELQNDANTVI